MKRFVSTELYVVFKGCSVKSLFVTRSSKFGEDETVALSEVSFYYPPVSYVLHIRHSDRQGSIIHTVGPISAALLFVFPLLLSVSSLDLTSL